MSPAPGVVLSMVAVVRIQHLLNEKSRKRWRSSDQVAPSSAIGPSDAERLASVDVPPNALLSVALGWASVKKASAIA